MDLCEYIKIVADKMKAEQERGDKQEFVRLAGVLADTLAEKIAELSKES